ncbi:MAG: VOC family protein [Gammaproteobacteria bacterium]|nr:VOC family protein [Gammaproteobacteria bacterium]
MVAFYCNVLGCSLERETSAGLVQLRAGTSLIDIVDVDSKLGSIGGGPPTDSGRNLDHFCLQLKPASEEEILRHLQTRGVQTGDFEERYGAEGFGRSLYINDPDGNIVELRPQLPVERIDATTALNR